MLDPFCEGEGLGRIVFIFRVGRDTSNPTSELNSKHSGIVPGASEIADSRVPEGTDIGRARPWRSAAGPASCERNERVPEDKGSITGIANVFGTDDFFFFIYWGSSTRPESSSSTHRIFDYVSAGPN